MNRKSPSNVSPIHAADHQPSDSNGATADPQALLAFCKASADQLRLDILRVLSRDSYGVQELCSIFDSKQSGMSHHLKVLANAGHNIDDDSLNELQQTLYAAVDRQPISALIQNKVNAVQHERAANSELFFAENADKFSQQQEQIAAYELYGPNAIELISRNFYHSKGSKVLEVGPGEGAFLAELAPRFQYVYAVDNSKPMLDIAATAAEQSGLMNISFIHGDTKDHRLQDLNADCAVVNMVLHHTPSPADIFFDLATALKKGGHLFVTDLCSHNQSWVRESCGDLWLGFEPEDLTLWAADAGFKTGENIYLAQRNGFRVQIRQFIKI